ncbi:hypothetical protein [Salinimonas chungwhensis]|uniref:hypothetical protein n=1 Tax=Salinimonas chungwhensis TaxID=265425 RepID=UPI000380331F|nr:hypothetical protein [Salinimonas chungwhensis]
MIEDTCFVLFSGDCNRYAQRTVKRLSKHLPCYILSYIEDAQEEIIEYPNFTHIIVTRDSLKSIFFDCSPKFNNKNWQIMPGNLDLAQLCMCEKFSKYNYYWFCEDDVRYTGNLSSFIDKMRQYRHDLIATNYRNILSGWAHIDSFQSPIDIQPTKTVFLPFFRVSQDAAQTIITSYRKGWAGHHEVSWPTILEFHRKQVIDLKELLPKAYTSNTDAMGMGPGTFIYEPSKLIAGFRKNTLYHPVKTGDVYYKRRIKPRLYKYKVKLYRLFNKNYT